MKKDWFAVAILFFGGILLGGLVHASTHKSTHSTHTQAHTSKSAHHAKESRHHEVLAQGQAVEDDPLDHISDDEIEQPAAGKALKSSFFSLYKRKSDGSLEPGFILSAWHDFTEKIDHIRNADEDNTRLRKQVAKLEIENAKLTALIVEGCKQKKRVGKITKRAIQEGGVRHARVIASLPKTKHLEDPSPADFEKLYKQGINKFNDSDYENAAPIFLKLVEEENYQNAQTYYFLGVSLFQLDNYKQAHKYFARAISMAKKTDSGLNDISYAPRSYAWIALCYNKLGNESASKRAVHDLIHRFPRSKEAQRLNRENS